VRARTGGCGSGSSLTAHLMVQLSCIYCLLLQHRYYKANSTDYVFTQQSNEQLVNQLIDLDHLLYSFFLLFIGCILSYLLLALEMFGLITSDKIKSLLVYKAISF
jgi:hypothetical protein